MDSNQRFAYLFYKYFGKKCEQYEKDDFFELLQQDEFDEILRLLIEETWKQHIPARQQNNETALAIFKHILGQRSGNLYAKTGEAPLNAASFQSDKMVTSALQPAAGVRLLPAIAIKPASANKRIYRPYAAAAAIILLTITSFSIYYHHRVPGAAPLAIVPKQATDQFLTLSDGSKVLLHDGAHIEYQSGFTGTTREVTLTGEAYFDIRHDRRPFIVHTGNIKTTVLGTAFNINALDKNITVTVTKGKVRVENDNGEFSILRRNEQLTVDIKHSHLKKKKVDANEIIAWKKPYLLFNDVSISEAVQELQHRFHVNIRLVNPALGSCNVTATFIREEPLEQIINVLSKINNMEYKIKSPTSIELSGEGCK